MNFAHLGRVSIWAKFYNSTKKNNDTNYKLFDYVFYICLILHNRRTRQKDLIRTLTHTLTR